MSMVLVPLLCLLLVAGLLKLLLASGWAARIAIDLPNERSLHAAPVPRIGGIVLIGVALAASALLSPALRPVLLIAAMLALISAWDDRHGLPVALRLAVHLAAAAGSIFVLQVAAPVWVMVALALLLTWAMNLFNFMDGSDGLAGGMALFGFGALGIAAAGSAPGVAVACICIAAASAGFLWHNFHPARVFLGDAGSIPLGFLVGSLGLAGWVEGLWPAWFPLLVFSPFVVDATLTLVARVLRGSKPWQPHREHAYQRMVAGGLGHRRTALLWYALMAACAASGLVGLRLDAAGQWTLVVAWVVIYGILAAVTTRRFPLPKKT
ncbi:MAG: glycosyltransferase family 4 protein [Burkholderiales bacterium]|nr:MAG: glycosyltransferase family 4 protein [Burkholderiales bacterium]